MGRGKWALEPSYGQASEGTRGRALGWDSNAGKRGSLAGHMGGCSTARGRVGGILRAVLRGTLRPVLRTIFRTALRSWGDSGAARGSKGGQDTA